MNVNLSSGKSSTGFESTKCMVCNDYKERGGFRFLFNDGFIYSCFNCGEKRVYNGDGNLSKAGKDLLTSFGLPIEEVKMILAKTKLAHLKNPGAVPVQVKEHLKAQPTIELPPSSFPINPLAEDADLWFHVAREYVSSRGFDPASIKAFISFDLKFIGRLILPVYDYTDTRLVYYQARSMDDSIEPRFKNPSVGKENSIFNEAALHSQPHQTIFVTEGIFDALSCGNGYGPAIAPMGSGFNEQILFKLRRASLRGKKLVFVIDKNKNGAKIATTALAEGWSIVFMPDNITDANACRVKLGSLFLTSWLATNQLTGIQAQIAIKLNCVAT